MGEDMLTGLDETLFHQGPAPFEAALLSDHRFYDRYVLSAVRADGEVGIVTGMAVYKNLNVMDGFVASQIAATRQRNMRLSRPLRPITLAHVLGPLRTEFVEPLKTLRFICDRNEQGDSFDLTFRGFLPHISRRITSAGSMAGCTRTIGASARWAGPTARRSSMASSMKSTAGSAGATIRGECGRESEGLSHLPAPRQVPVCLRPYERLASAFS